MAVEKSASKTDAVVKLVLVFFVCMLSFMIGTFVGKKFSDNQHKLAKYEPETTTIAEPQEREVASVDPHATEVKPSEALTDDEVAKLAEEFVSDEGGTKKEEHPTTEKNSEHSVEAKAEHGSEPAARKEESHAEAVHAAAATTTHAEPLKVAEKLAHGEAPGATTENVAKTGPRATTSRIPSSLPKELSSSAIGKYTVQVAAFPTEEEAQKTAADLKGKGFSAFYVSAKVNGKTWYRVSVGLFTTSTEAAAYKTDLMARAKVSAAVVQKIVE